LLSFMICSLNLHSCGLYLWVINIRHIIFLIILNDTIVLDFFCFEIVVNFNFGIRV
jgi:hypothetical protein